MTTPSPVPSLTKRFARYGNLGFPAAACRSPLDLHQLRAIARWHCQPAGQACFGRGDIAQSRADRWLMDLLRAHADGVLMGMNTLREEQRIAGPESRGIVFQVVEPELLRLREKLGKGRQRNIFVTRALDLDLSQWKVFDGDAVDAVIVTSPDGAERYGRANDASSRHGDCRRRRRHHRSCRRESVKLRRKLGSEVPAVRRRPDALWHAGARRPGGRKVRHRLAGRGGSSCSAGTGAPAERAGRESR